MNANQVNRNHPHAKTVKEKRFKHQSQHAEGISTQNVLCFNMENIFLSKKKNN